MSTYYKDGGSVMMVVDVHAWRQAKLTILRVALGGWRPTDLVACTDMDLGKLEPATADEWMSALAKAEKQDEELDLKKKKREEGKRYGVTVRRYRLSFGKREKMADDVIVRCTKTRWVGIDKSYRRGSDWQAGAAVGEPRYAYTKMIDTEDLVMLERKADGRERVDFVKEGKQARL